ncbi:pp1a [Bovine nidovirus TCH5]|uniref:Pp1a n=1 Tax=Bovine nidovirus TCH5 TaxID=1631554 RepID=A0A0F6PN25_9NIDO|nr:pp1a [Bovine nidovirus TCH5]AJW66851.1 pp1a [Bovine nidovirus TCH5]
MACNMFFQKGRQEEPIRVRVVLCGKKYAPVNQLPRELVHLRSVIEEAVSQFSYFKEVEPSALTVLAKFMNVPHPRSFEEFKEILAYEGYEIGRDWRHSHLCGLVSWGQEVWEKGLYLVSHGECVIFTIEQVPKAVRYEFYPILAKGLSKDIPIAPRTSIEFYGFGCFDGLTAYTCYNQDGVEIRVGPFSRSKYGMCDLSEFFLKRTYEPRDDPLKRVIRPGHVANCQMARKWYASQLVEYNPREFKAVPATWYSINRVEGHFAVFCDSCEADLLGSGYGFRVNQMEVAFTTPECYKTLCQIEMLLKAVYSKPINMEKVYAGELLQQIKFEDIPSDLVDAVGQYENLHGHRVLKQLGRGSYGCAFQVVTPESFQYCAKFVETGECDEEIVTQTKLAKVFEFVPQVYGSVSLGNCTVHKMELIRGTTLHKVCIDKYDAKDLFRQVVAAEKALYEHGVWHGDMHTNNIMVTRDGKIKVLDYGLSRAAASPDRSKWLFNFLQDAYWKCTTGISGFAARKGWMIFSVLGLPYVGHNFEDHVDSPWTWLFFEKMFDVFQEVYNVPPPPPEYKERLQLLQEALTGVESDIDAGFFMKVASRYLAVFANEEKADFPLYNGQCKVLDAEERRAPSKYETSCYKMDAHSALGKLCVLNSYLEDACKIGRSEYDWWLATDKVPQGYKCGQTRNFAGRANAIYQELYEALNIANGRQLREIVKNDVMDFEEDIVYEHEFCLEADEEMLISDYSAAQRVAEMLDNGGVGRYLLNWGSLAEQASLMECDSLKSRPCDVSLRTVIMWSVPYEVKLDGRIDMEIDVFSMMTTRVNGADNQSLMEVDLTKDVFVKYAEEVVYYIKEENVQSFNAVEYQHCEVVELMEYKAQGVKVELQTIFEFVGLEVVDSYVPMRRFKNDCFVLAAREVLSLMGKFFTRASLDKLEQRFQKRQGDAIELIQRFAEFACGYISCDDCKRCDEPCHQFGFYEGCNNCKLEFKQGGYALVYTNGVDSDGSCAVIKGVRRRVLVALCYVGNGTTGHWTACIQNEEGQWYDTYAKARIGSPVNVKACIVSTLGHFNAAVVVPKGAKIVGQNVKVGYCQVNNPCNGDWSYVPAGKHYKALRGTLEIPPHMLDEVFKPQVKQTKKNKGRKRRSRCKKSKSPAKVADLQKEDSESQKRDQAQKQDLAQVIPAQVMSATISECISSTSVSDCCKDSWWSPPLSPALPALEEESFEQIAAVSAAGVDLSSTPELKMEEIRLTPVEVEAMQRNVVEAQQEEPMQRNVGLKAQIEQVFEVDPKKEFNKLKRKVKQFVAKVGEKCECYKLVYGNQEDDFNGLLTDAIIYGYEKFKCKEYMVVGSVIYFHEVKYREYREVIGELGKYAIEGKKMVGFRKKKDNKEIIVLKNVKYMYENGFNSVVEDFECDVEYFYEDSFQWQNLMLAIPFCSSFTWISLFMLLLIGSTFVFRTPLSRVVEKCLVWLGAIDAKVRLTLPVYNKEGVRKFGFAVACAGFAAFWRSITVFRPSIDLNRGSTLGVFAILSWIGLLPSYEKYFTSVSGYQACKGYGFYCNLIRPNNFYYLSEYKYYMKDFQLVYDYTIWYKWIVFFNPITIVFDVFQLVPTEFSVLVNVVLAVVIAMRFKTKCCNGKQCCAKHCKSKGSVMFPVDGVVKHLPFEKRGWCSKHQWWCNNSTVHYLPENIAEAIRVQAELNYKLKGDKDYYKFVGFQSSVKLPIKFEDFDPECVYNVDDLAFNVFSARCAYFSYMSGRCVKLSSVDGFKYVEQKVEMTKQFKEILGQFGNYFQDYANVAPVGKENVLHDSVYQALGEDKERFLNLVNNAGLSFVISVSRYDDVYDGIVPSDIEVGKICYKMHYFNKVINLETFASDLHEAILKSANKLGYMIFKPKQQRKSMFNCMVYGIMAAVLLICSLNYLVSRGRLGEYAGVNPYGYSNPDKPMYVYSGDKFEGFVPISVGVAHPSVQAWVSLNNGSVLFSSVKSSYVLTECTMQDTYEEVLMDCGYYQPAMVTIGPLKMMLMKAGKVYQTVFGVVDAKEAAMCFGSVNNYFCINNIVSMSMHKFLLVTSMVFGCVVVFIIFVNKFYKFFGYYANEVAWLCFIHIVSVGLYSVFPFALVFWLIGISLWLNKVFVTAYSLLMLAMVVGVNFVLAVVLSVLLVVFVSVFKKNPGNGARYTLDGLVFGNDFKEIAMSSFMVEPHHLGMVLASTGMTFAQLMAVSREQPNRKTTQLAQTLLRSNSQKVNVPYDGSQASVALQSVFKRVFSATLNVAAVQNHCVIVYNDVIIGNGLLVDSCTVLTARHVYVEGCKVRYDGRDIQVNSVEEVGFNIRLKVDKQSCKKIVYGDLNQCVSRSLTFYTGVSGVLKSFVVTLTPSGHVPFSATVPGDSGSPVFYGDKFVGVHQGKFDKHGIITTVDGKCIDESFDDEKLTVGQIKFDGNLIVKNVMKGLPVCSSEKARKTMVEFIDKLNEMNVVKADYVDCNKDFSGVECVIKEEYLVPYEDEIIFKTAKVAKVLKYAVLDYVMAVSALISLITSMVVNFVSFNNIWYKIGSGVAFAVLFARRNQLLLFLMWIELQTNVWLLASLSVIALIRSGVFWKQSLVVFLSCVGYYYIINDAYVACVLFVVVMSGGRPLFNAFIMAFVVSGYGDYILPVVLFISLRLKLHKKIEALFNMLMTDNLYLSSGYCFEGETCEPNFFSALFSLFVYSGSVVEVTPQSKFYKCAVLAVSPTLNEGAKFKAMLASDESLLNAHVVAAVERIAKQEIVQLQRWCDVENDLDKLYKWLDENPTECKERNAVEARVMYLVAQRNKVLKHLEAMQREEVAKMVKSDSNNKLVGLLNNAVASLKEKADFRYKNIQNGTFAVSTSSVPQLLVLTYRPKDMIVEENDGVFEFVFDESEDPSQVFIASCVKTNDGSIVKDLNEFNALKPSQFPVFCEFVNMQGSTGYNVDERNLRIDSDGIYIKNNKVAEFASNGDFVVGNHSVKLLGTIPPAYFSLVVKRLLMVPVLEAVRLGGLANCEEHYAISSVPVRTNGFITYVGESICDDCRSKKDHECQYKGKFVQLPAGKQLKDVKLCKHNKFECKVCAKLQSVQVQSKQRIRNKFQEYVRLSKQSLNC